MFATGATSDNTKGGRAYKHHSSYTQNSSEVEGVHVRLQQIVHRDDIDMDMERGKVDEGLKRDLSRDWTWIEVWTRQIGESFDWLSAGEYVPKIYLPIYLS